MSFRFIILPLCLFVEIAACAQDTTRYVRWYTAREQGLYAGGVLNARENKETSNNFLGEIGWIKTRYSQTIHPTFSAIYVSNEFGINTKNLVWGPKVGVSAGFVMFMVGAELLCYTDFNDGTLRFAPYVGYGFHQFRLSVNPQIPIVNKDFPMNTVVNVNLMVRVLRLKKKIYPFPS